MKCVDQEVTPLEHIRKTKADEDCKRQKSKEEQDVWDINHKRSESGWKTVPGKHRCKMVECADLENYIDVSLSRETMAI